MDEMVQVLEPSYVNSSKEDGDIVYAVSNSGLNMRETVRSLSAVGVGYLKGSSLQYERT